MPKTRLMDGKRLRMEKSGSTPWLPQSASPQVLRSIFVPAEGYATCGARCGIDLTTRERFPLSFRQDGLHRPNQTLAEGRNTKVSGSFFGDVLHRDKTPGLLLIA